MTVVASYRQRSTINSLSDANAFANAYAQPSMASTFGARENYLMRLLFLHEIREREARKAGRSLARRGL